MKHAQVLMAALILGAAASVSAQSPNASERAKAAVAKARCGDCGTVQAVREEKRKGEGGVVGIGAGAVAGGLLGNQIGSGNGRALATVGGAVAGGFVGNEVQKKVTTKTVWVTAVKLKDGTVKNFETEAKPGWTTGQLVKVSGTTLSKP